MSTVPERPSGASSTDLPAHRIDLADPAVRAARLGGAGTHATDVVAVRHDIAASSARRMLGRTAVREHAREAARANAAGGAP